MKTLVLVLCIITVASATPRAQCTDDYILVSTTDFSSGSSSSLDPVTKAPSLNVQAIHSDAVLRTGPLGDRRIYVVSRAGGDNIHILDPCNGFDTIDQFSTGNGSNPHDIVVLSPTVAYVTRYDMTSVLKMNPSTGATLTTISLAAFADADELPEMDQMIVANGRLYVLLQRLDRPNFYSPTANSFAAVIDLATDTLIDMGPAPGIQPLTLIRTNPYSEVNYRMTGGAAQAYFSAVGFFGLQDAGVIAFDLATETQSMMFTENAAGGDILDVEIISDTKGFAIIATPSFTTELIAFNPSTGLKLGAAIYAPGGYDLNDIEPSPVGLLLTDRKPTNPGVRCFDMVSNAQTTVNPIDTGLPPFDIALEIGTPTAAGDTPRMTALGPNFPNPFNPVTAIPVTLARAGSTTLRILDVSGRVVATLLEGTQPAGARVVMWNGRDARGNAVPSGVYFARLDAGGASHTQKLVLLK